MAILSNINDKFRVDSAGAVYFGTSAGTNGQILKSIGTGGSPVWIDQTDITGPFVLKAGDTMTGPLVINGSNSLTVGGTLSGSTATFTGNVDIGPDALDIQIKAASNNSGNNLIYMRGNASNDKSSLQINHFGYADYYIGVGHVGNGKFNISNDLTGNDFVIDTNGKVGIGLTDPGSKLHVKGDMVTIEDPSGGFKMELSADANPVTIMSDNRTGAAYGEMAFIAGNGSDANDQTRMVIDSSGSVGIGTDSPGAKLVISNGGALGYEIDPANASGEIVSIFSYNRSTAAWKTTRYSALDHRFEINGTTEAMRIDSSGNVGIGNTNPSYKIDAKQTTSGNGTCDLRLAGRRANSTTSFIVSTIYAENFDNGTGDVTIGKIDFSIDGDASSDQSQYGKMIFSTANNSSEVIALTIDSSQNIGIGTTSPNKELTLGGAAGTQTLSFTTSAYLGDQAVIGNIEFSTHNADASYAQLANIYALKTGTNTNSGDITFWTKRNGARSEKIRIENDGTLRIKEGSIIIDSTSQGIFLGGTAAINKLDFYKTDTWAPQIYYQNATDQANATNSTQTGIYTKIGNVCTVQFRLIWTQASGTPAVDNIGIKNLPFGGNTTQAYAEVPCSLIGYTGGPSPRGNLTLTLPGANLTLAIFNDTNNVGNMGNAIGSGTKEIRFSFTYLTN